MGAEKETEHFFSSSEGLYESAHAGILVRTFYRPELFSKVISSRHLYI